MKLKALQAAILGSAIFALGLLAAGPAAAALPVSLDQVPVPEPQNLFRFVKDKQAAIRLGKALFWDMQTGSDGETACASCHFHAGTDNRARNTLGRPPGLGGSFQGGGANAEVTLADFPFHRLANPDNRGSGGTNPNDPAVLSDRTDVIGAQGVPKTDFQQIVAGQGIERGRTVRDALFGRNARNVRQVTGRNTPSVINAVFNHSSFWDGRAHHFFNGVNPFGILDVDARVHINTGNGLSELDLTGNLANNPFALDMASLASQAVGPPPNEVEMSWNGRGWPDIGRKLLTLRPLDGQQVHTADSVLAPLAIAGGTGLNTTYGDLIRAAFQDEFWNSPQTVGGYTQMENNFSLFFGLAVQLYEATLVADDTPFDRFLRGNAQAMTARQQRGMNLFLSGGTGCFNCHVGPELTAASISQTLAPDEAGLIELMSMGDGNLANYDIGFYNIGVRPTAEDLGRGDTAPPFIRDLAGQQIPLSFTGQHFARANLPFAPLAQPGCVNDFLGDPPTICPPAADSVTRQAVDGAFKTPGLRNVELTGPYMHNGGMATLMQIVDFYVRGGDFHEANIANLDPFIDTIGGMQGDEEKKAEMVDFLLALTDERVRWERAPFDHPQLFIPDGHDNRFQGDPRRSRVLADRTRTIPAVGAAGRQAQGLPPLKPFLADDLTGAALTNFHFQH